MHNRAALRPLRPLMLGSCSRGFWLMCLSSFLFFLSFNLLLPELPQHLADLGGADCKRFIILLFTLTAAMSRPFSDGEGW